MIRAVVYARAMERTSPETSTTTCCWTSIERDMTTTIATKTDLQLLQREVASLRLELADVRMRKLLNSLTFDLGLMLTAACVVFFVAMKLT